MGQLENEQHGLHCSGSEVVAATSKPIEDLELYAADARGIHDEELIDDVGYSLVGHM